MTMAVRHPLLSLPACAVAACLLLAGACQGARAGQAEPDGPPPGWSGPPPGWSGGVLAGAARAPDFEGSRTMRTQPVLGMAVTYRSASMGSVEMGSRGLNWTLVQQPDLKAGIGLAMDPGRVDDGRHKLTAVGYRPGSERLRGMGEVRMAPVVSAFGSATVAGVPLSAALRHAAGSHQGTLLDVGLSVPWKAARHVDLALAPGVTWADRRWMQAYFGVTAEQAAASGRPAFHAGSGLKSAQLSLTLDMALSRHWHLNAEWQGRRLLGDAADSPVAEKRVQTGVMLGLLRTFQW